MRLQLFIFGQGVMLSIVNLTLGCSGQVDRAVPLGVEATPTTLTGAGASSSDTGSGAAVVDRKSLLSARSGTAQTKPWAVAGYDPCERAYDINVRLTQNALTAYQKDRGLREGPAANTAPPSVLPKPEFLIKCNSMPIGVRRCMDLEYQFENTATCNAAQVAFVENSKGAHQ